MAPRMWVYETDEVEAPTVKWTRDGWTMGLDCKSVDYVAINLTCLDLGVKKVVSTSLVGR